MNLVHNLHSLALPFSGIGKLVIASYGEDPTTGNSLLPQVRHFSIGDVNDCLAVINLLGTERHRNVYAPLAVFRPDLPEGKKGGETDILGVLGLVADFDDAEAANWPTRLPLPPDYVLETSPGRFQCGYLFDSPVTVAEAKALGTALKNQAQCDHGTADMSHVWRLPDTLNWPNAKKVKGGRSTEPWTVRTLHCSAAP